MQLALRTNSPTEIRRDCADPSRLYVKINNKWFTAFNQDIMLFVNMTNFDKMFASMSWPLLKSIVAEQKITIQRNTHKQLQLVSLPPVTDNSVCIEAATNIDTDYSDTADETDNSHYFIDAWKDVNAEIVVNGI